MQSTSLQIQTALDVFCVPFSISLLKVRISSSYLSLSPGDIFVLKSFCGLSECSKAEAVEQIDSDLSRLLDSQVRILTWLSCVYVSLHLIVRHFQERQRQGNPSHADRLLIKQQMIARSWRSALFSSGRSIRYYLSREGSKSIFSSRCVGALFCVCLRSCMRLCLQVCLRSCLCMYICLQFENSV